MKRLVKWIFPAIVSIIVIGINTFASEKPVVKDKKVIEKSIPVKKANNRTDYLKYITPKAINDVTSGEMNYKKDAKGVYQLVPKEGC